MRETDPRATPGRRRRWAVRATMMGLLAATAVAVAVLLRGGEDAPAAQTVEVTRDDVRATVAGVGTLRSSRSAALSFRAGGRVTSVTVVAGQRVRRGQVLARLDDTVARSQLRSARAEVASTRAALAQLITGRSSQERRQSAAQVRAAGVSLGDAVRSIAKARTVARADRASLRTALVHARLAHRAAAARMRDDRVKLRRATARSATLQRSELSAKAAVGRIRARQIDVAAGRRDLSKRQADATEARSGAENALTEAKTEQTDQRAAVTTARTAAAEACSATPGGPACQSAQTAVADAEAAAAAATVRVTAAQRRVDEMVRGATDSQKAGFDADFSDAQLTRELERAQADLANVQTQLERTRSQRDALRTALPGDRDTNRAAAAAVAAAARAASSGRATSKQTIQTAQASANAARDALRLARATAAVEDQPPRPAALGAARALFATARTSLATARESLDDNVVRAPMNGVVAQVGLSVGDVVSGGNGVTSAAARGGKGGAAGGGGSEGGAGGDAAGDGGGGGGGAGTAGTITVTSARLSVFSAPLTQGDAVRTRPGADVELLVHAVRRTVGGRVVRVSPVANTQNGVVSYTATIVSDQVPKRMRAGMTADVTIVTGRRRGVVALPLAALPAGGGAAQVSVLAGRRTVARPIRLGLRGDEVVEVLSGLRPGERVILASDASGPESGEAAGPVGGGDAGP